MSSDMKDTELDRILGKYAEVLMEHFKRVVVQGDLTVVPAKETLRSELQQLIKRETDKARISELEQLKAIDAFNDPYTTDPRPAKLVSIRLKELKQQQTNGGSE